VSNSFTAADFAVDLLAPNRCPFCGEFIVWNSFSCKACEGEIIKLPYNEPPINTNRVFAAFAYEGKTKTAIYEFKYKQAVTLAAFAAEVIVNSPEFNAENFDLCVPVPMHRSKLHSRYYNPAEVFAKRIKKLTGIPVLTSALSHAKTGTLQHSLSEIERFENAKKVYSKNHTEEIGGKRILLCDDVITTGATIGVCAKLLIEGGAKSVSAAVCAATSKNFI
jgi:competence protein ComFC